MEFTQVMNNYVETRDLRVLNIKVLKGEGTISNLLKLLNNFPNF